MPTHQHPAIDRPAQLQAMRAAGRVVSIGRRVAFAEATLRDGKGRLCASATSTLLVFALPD
ncbi:hypothetical protein GCM10022268_05490 [Sphingomonas cynarae]|uniref:PaaI family thioesterase n=1 Tax=Sphingomonas cynarae TaxID=930197 RepID=A0ABP7D195_9SPHN